MAVETVPMDDSEMFRSAMTDEPAAEVTAEEQPSETAEERRARDEKGRFVAAEPKAESPAVEPAAEIKEEPDAAVPSWRARELREQRDQERAQLAQERQQRTALQQEVEAMRREMTQLRAPKEEPVDFYTDPNAAIQQRLTPFEQQLQGFKNDTGFKISRLSAMVEYGKDSVLEMEKYIGEQNNAGNPSLRALGVQMSQSDDPVGTAMQWYQQDKLAKETGGDLNKYREKLLDDEAFVAKAIERQRAKLQQQPNQTRPNIQLPPSLNKATGTAGHNSDDSDMSDAAIFKYAASSGRR